MVDDPGGLPLFEHDYAPAAVLDPDHEGLGVTLPETAVFAFLGDVIDDYARELGAPVAAVHRSVTRDFPVYLVPAGEKTVSLCRAPVGSAQAALLMDWLLSYGVRTVISAGSCGALTQMEEDAFVIPVRALRDEGASYHYLPPARWVDTDESVNALLLDTLRAEGIPCRECLTWTTDGFYRETPALVERRRSEGCGVVEMECAAMAACARFRGARFGMLLFTADSLADVTLHDGRNWGRGSLRPALELCLKAAARA
jgi:uridine phosphorylase